MEVINMLWKEDSIEHLFVIMTGAESCQITYECPNPQKFKKKGIVVLKLTSEAINDE